MIDNKARRVLYLRIIGASHSGTSKKIENKPRRVLYLKIIGASHSGTSKVLEEPLLVIHD